MRTSTVLALMCAIFTLSASAPKQLFDLESDPNELKNVADEHPDVAVELEKDLRHICLPEIENQRTEKFIQAQLKAIRELEAIPKSMLEKQTA